MAWHNIQLSEALWAAVIGLGVLVLLLLPLRRRARAWALARERTREFGRWVAQLRAIFGEATHEPRAFAADRVHVSDGRRRWEMYEDPPRRLHFRIEPDDPPPITAVIRSKSALPPRSVRIGWTSLPQFLTGDPLLDDVAAFYARDRSARILLRAMKEEIRDSTADDGPAASFVLLSHIAGTAGFEIVLHPRRGFDAAFDLRTDDLWYTPEELEAVLHHLYRIRQRILSIGE